MSGEDGISWVERHSAFNDADHCRFVDEDFTGHSLDTLDLWRVQNTGGRGTSDLKDDDANGVLAMVTGNQAADEMILDMNDKRQVDPSLFPVLLVRAKADAITTVEMRIGLVDVLGTDDCYFLVDLSAIGDASIYAEAHSGGGAATEHTDTGINLDVNYHYYGIYIDDAGKPYWYIDGTLEVTGDNADVDPTEFFQPYVQVEAEAGAAARTLEVDFIKGWQLRE